MKRLGVSVALALALALAACGTAGTNMAVPGAHGDGGGALAAPMDEAGTSDAGEAASADAGGVRPDDSGTNGDGSASGCPAGYTMGTANGLAVCRAPSGIPLFTSVFLILMENTSL